MKTLRGNDIQMGCFGEQIGVDATDPTPHKFSAGDQTAPLTARLKRARWDG